MNGNAKEYALAVFALALEGNAMAEIHDDLIMIRDLLKENSGYMEYLVNPAIPKSERSKNLASIFENNVCEDVFAFMNILCEHGDMYVMDDAIAEFCEMYEDYMRFSKAVVTSAVELTEEEKVKLITKLQAVTGKRIEAEFKTDKSLIGGVTVDVDGKFYDGSVRKNLSNIKEVIS